jgi:hypothetical protein
MKVPNTSTKSDNVEVTGNVTMLGIGLRFLLKGRLGEVGVD